MSLTRWFWQIHRKLGSFVLIPKSSFFELFWSAHWLGGLWHSLKVSFGHSSRGKHCKKRAGEDVLPREWFRQIRLESIVVRATVEPVEDRLSQPEPRQIDPRKISLMIQRISRRRLRRYCRDPRMFVFSSVTLSQHNFCFISAPSRLLQQAACFRHLPFRIIFVLVLESLLASSCWHLSDSYLILFWCWFVLNPRCLRYLLKADAQGAAPTWLER